MSEQFSHDIFISFSFVDQRVAEEVVNALTSKYGFSCWICTRDIAGGTRYKALIPHAIDEARAVVFIQSENALASREVPKEIGMAVDADKPIIPFRIDQAQPQGDLRYDLYGVEYIDATVPTREQRIHELAKAISKSIGKPLLTETAASGGVPDAEKLISTPSVIPKSVFCGREDVIGELTQKFAGGERVVFLQGIGGIGKTEIAKQYIRQNRKNYDTVVFATYADSLMELVNGETPFELKPAFPRRVAADGIPEDDRSFFVRKIREIQNAGNRTQIAYRNLLRMFKVFDLTDEEKTVLRYLSLMPLSGVTVRDLKTWAKLHSLKVLNDLERRSWILRKTSSIALHPIIRDVIRHELPPDETNCAGFLSAFIDTIREERSWHYQLAEKEKYAAIALSILTCFPEINSRTVTLYQASEILCSFSVRPAAAVELAEQIYRYYESSAGKYTFETGRAAFKTGWAYAFNLRLDNALDNAEKWLTLAADILGRIRLDTVEEHFEFIHTLVKLSEVSLLLREATGEDCYLEKAGQYATAAVREGEQWIPENDPHHSKAGGYMQLADVCIAAGDYEQAMPLIDAAYEKLYSYFGADDPDTLYALARKGEILYGMQRYDEAIELSDRIMEKYDLFYSRTNADRYRCSQLAIKLKCLQKTGRTDEAKEISEQLLELAEKVFNPDAKQLREIRQAAEALLQND